MIFVIVAPSGTGKSTIMEMVKEDVSVLRESISYTTRSPRRSEVHGEDYYFIDQAQFETMIKEEAFIEYATVHGNFYGTAKKFLELALAKKQPILCDLDVQGADSIKKHFKEKAKVIFITPPSFEELKKRLYGRGTEDNSVIEIRLENARQEMLRKDDYDFCVVNDDLKKASEQVRDIILQELDKL